MFIDPSKAVEEIKPELRKVLETWPLYRELKFKRPPGTHDSYWVLPSQLTLYCHRCQNPQLWQRTDCVGTDPLMKSSGGGSPGRAPQTDIGHKIADYVCRNCGVERTSFYYHWHKRQDEWVFYKAGQFPPPDERIDRELEHQLKGEDIDFYRKALRLRNHRLGIGCLGYLRRVVENSMNDLLDLIAEEAKAAGFAENDLNRIEEVKASWRFADKIDFAGRIVPPRLRPDGKNPFGLLHALASEGLHAKSEDECIEIFDQSRAVFEYFFRELTLERQAREGYRHSLLELTKRSGQPSSGG